MSRQELAFEPAIGIYQEWLPFCENRFEGVDGEEEESVARRNSWLELMHRLVFLTASCHFQLGQTDEETALYARAETIRGDLLRPSLTLVSQTATRTLPIVEKNSFEIQKLEPLISGVQRFYGGIAAGDLLEGIHSLSNTLNNQWNTLSEWRITIHDLLASPVTPSDDSENPTGEEYATGIEAQDKAATYMVCLTLSLYLIT